MASAATEPPVDLFADTGILNYEEGRGVLGHAEDVEDLHDFINGEVGRQAWVGPYAAQECLVPASPQDGEDPSLAGPQAPGDPGPAVFDRLYLPSDAHPAPLLVDLVLVGRGGIELTEAAKHVPLKRAWCKTQGVEYVVVTEDETYL